MDTELDTLVPNFRLAKEHWSEAPTLASHYQSLVDSYNSNSFALIETIKSFIESVCFIILVEFGQSMPTGDPSTTEMLVETLRCLGFQNTRGASKLDKVLSAYNRLADALSDMRNENGPIAHGKDGFLDNLSNNHMRAFLFIGDTLLGLLLSALEGKEPDLKFTREPYERFSHLHDRIDYSVAVETSVEDDEESPVIVIKMSTGGQSDDVILRVEPSRLLYNIDRTAYVELLSASEIEQVEIPEYEEAIAEPEAKRKETVARDTSPTVEIQKSYSGVLAPLRTAFESYLDTLGISNSLVTPDGENIIDSLLATADNNMGTDWTVRQMSQAIMKRALRRVLLKFEIDPQAATDATEQLITWLKMQDPGIKTLNKVGILAYGSLIADPGSEINELTHHTIKDVETPFAVEYARSSSTRSGAPTLVPVEDKEGIPVKANIFVLAQEADLNAVKNILYRRERHKVGDASVEYPPPRDVTSNTVIVDEIKGFRNVETVFYTRIGSNIPEITDNDMPDESKAQLLAGLAIDSVTDKTFNKEEDGISYLASAIEAGVITKLTESYKQAIFHSTNNSQNLKEARLWVARQKQMI